MVRMTIAAALLAVSAAGVSAAEPIKALLVDGQNNHNWKAVSPVLKQALETSGRFTVDVATTPPDKSKMDEFKPAFSKYAVVVSNYNGDLWPAETCKAFETYVAGGGGLVIVHAADNAFPKWDAYNKMIGLGGWGGRNEKSGPMIRWRDGEIVRDTQPGPGGTHGKNHEFVVDTRAPDHPIMAGLPARWKHTSDELYAKMRGPAENLTLLATAYADKANGGTGEHEPILFTIAYGNGRVFHTVLGHDVRSVKCVGFVTTLLRGAEWAATGKVTIPVPANFPGPDASVVWEPPAGP